MGEHKAATMDEPEGKAALRAALAAADDLRDRPVDAVRPPAAVIDGQLLPALTAHLGGLMAGRTDLGAPDAVRTAWAILTLAQTAGPAGERRTGTRLALADARRAVRQAAARVQEHLGDALIGGDAPDVPLLSREVLRLEGLRFVAETLGDSKAVEGFAYFSRRIARVAFTRAAATVDAFVAERDLMRLFDNAIVVGQVDDMLTLALRVLDAKAACEEETTSFVEPADQAALGAFVAALERLALALTELARRIAAGKGGDAFFPGLLGQIGCILAFCRRLAHSERPERLDNLSRRVASALEDIADIVIRAPIGDKAAERRRELLAASLTVMQVPHAAARLAAMIPGASAETK